jgi:anthranilate synthase component 1
MMIYPLLAEAEQLRQQYPMIPICKTVIDDTETPISLFLRFPKTEYSFLFESVEGEQKLARYSFMGSHPFRIIKGREGKYTVTEEGKSQSFELEDPLSLIQDHLQEFQTPCYPDLPPFLGGVVGYLSYEVVRQFEPVLARQPLKDGGTGAYDVHLMFYDRLLVYDHFKRQILLVQNIPAGDPEDPSFAKRYKEAVQGLEAWYRELKETTYQVPPLLPITDKEVSLKRAKSNVSKEQYMEMVRKAQEYIKVGDIFQVVPSQRWTWKDAPSPMTVYRVLRQLNPSPYMYYLELNGETIVGTSPELLVQVNNGLIHTRPIAGSRPRGKSAAEDEALLRDLMQDEKEIAEHVMLVDLGRNDVGRVSEYGTVRVTEQMVIEKYSHMMHLVSHVVGKLRAEYSPLEAIKACFPAGTVSGAPKIRAMEIIAELEPEPRGIYAGAIGYLSFDGNVDTCIAIRTIYFRDSVAYIQAGGGVVADSVPENEYMESVNKAKAMLKALDLAEKIEQQGRNRDDSRAVIQGAGEK